MVDDAVRATAEAAVPRSPRPRTLPRGEAIQTRAEGDRPNAAPGE